MRKEMNEHGSRERNTVPERENFDVFRNGFVEETARRHGIPEDSPGKVKDVLKAASQVSFENLPEKAFPEGLPGIFTEAATRVETVAQNLPLNPKQQEFAKGLEENFKGAAGFFSVIGEKAKEFFPKEKGKIVQKAATSLLVAQMALSACNPVDHPQIPEAAFTETPVPAETFTPTPTKTATPTEIPEGKIILNENSFIPTGEYPKNGDNLILLDDENVGEAAKEVVIENGLGDQAKLIEEMYQSALDQSRLHSPLIPPGATLSFTYLVSNNKDVGNWTVIPQLNGFGVPRIAFPVTYNSETGVIRCLPQNEIMNMAAKGTYRKDYLVIYVPSPVGFGKESKISYFTDENGNFVVGISDEKSGKPLVWYNREKAVWQTDVSVNETDENTNLQENIDLWMKGNFLIPDDKKFKFGQDIAQLGLLDVSETGSLYQGIILGTERYEGNLVAYFGFEDKNYKHFFIPFSIGSIDSDSAIIGLTRPVHTNIVFGSNRDVESRLSINTAGEVFNHMQMKAIGLSAMGAVLEMECQNETVDELKSLCNKQMEISKSLPELFYSINNYGSRAVKNSLVNGIVGKDGLSLSDVPLIYVFSILPKDEPTLDDY
ncbi:MAG: hypothetical protein ABFC57_08735 [Veillonellales bacterium]